MPNGIITTSSRRDRTGGRLQARETGLGLKSNQHTGRARVLFVDIETAPSLGWYYDLWKEGNIVSTVKSWYILSFSWKWEGEKTTHVKGLIDYSGYKNDKENDKALLRELWNLLDEADVVIAHNGDGFDIPKINARFIKHGFGPPSPYKTIDTIKVARKHFKFDSNRLNEIGKYLGVGMKVPTTGFRLWEGCMRGDVDSWNLMKRYNKQDVVLLEKTYLKLRGWMTSGPNLSIIAGQKRTGCPSCGGHNRQRRGYSCTATKQMARLQCKDCGKWDSEVIGSIK